MATTAEKITEVETARAEYIVARSRILTSGQAYSIGNRSLTHADLQFIEEQIKKFDADLVALNRGNAITMHRVVPRDF